MAAAKPPVNPFHVLLGLSGLLFTFTAVAFTVLMLREDQRPWSRPAQTTVEVTEFERTNREHPLMQVLRDQGGVILGIEIGLVAVFAFAAMGLDRIRDRSKLDNNAKSAVLSEANQSVES